MSAWAADHRNRKSSLIPIQGTRGHGCLSDLNEIAIRIAHVAPHLRCMDLGFGYELRAPRCPELVAAPNIGHAKVDEVAEDVWIAGRRSDDVGLIVGPSASAVDREPDVRKPEKRRLSVTQHRGTKHVPIESDRPFLCREL